MNTEIIKHIHITSSLITMVILGDTLWLPAEKKNIKQRTPLGPACSSYILIVANYASQEKS